MSSFTLKPSMVNSENMIEIVESTYIESTGLFSFAKTVEKKIVLKMRSQSDAIEMMSLLQQMKDSCNN